MNHLTLRFWIILLFALLIALFWLNWWAILKYLCKKVFAKIMTTLLTDPYGENLLELYHAVKRSGGQTILENSLRAERGEIIRKPLGSSRQFPDFSGLMFDVAQLHILPTEQETTVDTTVIIGPAATKPLPLANPIIVSGMAFGLGLSAKAKIALARGAALAGTASNSGEGPFLQAERDNAKYWILQYNRGFWCKEPEILRQADAIEIQFGQGALAGLSHRLPAWGIDERLQRAFPIPPGQDAIVKARHPEVQKPADLINLVQKIRQQVVGIPVGIKIAASKDLELDLEVAVDAGVDFISLSGAQGGSHGAPPSIGESYSLPTLFALVRAARYFEDQHLKGKISLISAGGYSEPGEILKALALGADAVYIGTAALFAISHTQVLKPLPWEPPTQVAWYDGKFSGQFDENLGAINLANFIKSTTQEIADGLRAMGKTALKQVSKQDMFALDKITAEIVGVPLGYEPTPYSLNPHRKPSPTPTCATALSSSPSNHHSYRVAKKSK